MSARDDYPSLAGNNFDLYASMLGTEVHAALDEIDKLRADQDVLRAAINCWGECEIEAGEIVHRPMCPRWEP